MVDLIKNNSMYIGMALINIGFLVSVLVLIKVRKMRESVGYRRISDKKRNAEKSSSLKHKVTLKLDKLTNRFKEERVLFKNEGEYEQFILFQYILPVFFLIVILLKNPDHPMPGVLLPVLYYSFNRTKIKKLKDKNQLVFQKNTYKIYKFIHNQITSGIRPYDCIMGIHDVIDDPVFKNALMNMAAIYSQTSNIELSLEPIVSLYPGIDSIMLCNTIKEGLYVGNDMRTVERQEKLAFNKYFAYIKSESEGIKFKGFINVTLYGIIIIMLMGVPIIIEMQEATGKIFSN